MGDRIAILKDGALVQYDTPEAILAAPADAFVEAFVGADRALKRLALIPASDAIEPGGAALPATRTAIDGAASLARRARADAVARRRCARRQRGRQAKRSAWSRWPRFARARRPARAARALTAPGRAPTLQG